MPKVTRDGDLVLLSIPESTLWILVEHIVSKMVEQEDKSISLLQKIINQWEVSDDKKDQINYSNFWDLIDVVPWSIVLDAPEALQLCDDLADTIYEEPKQGFGPVIKQKQEKHLRIVKICVDCHKGFIKGEPHDCVVR